MYASPLERRRSPRFPLVLQLRYRVLEGLRTVARGTGATIDISRSGLRFRTNRELPEGARVEIVVAWPVLLGGFYPLELCIVGMVLPRRGADCVVRIGGWQFRLPTDARADGVVSIAGHGWTRCASRGRPMAP